MAYTNSPLVSYTKLSPNNSGQRKNTIDRITPHCVVGQVTVERLGEIFANPNRKASSNYGIGLDGRVGMYVPESNRSWCSSSADNDNKSVTIECASDTTAPYAFRDVVYQRLIELCVDICQRNGKDILIWFDNKNTALSYKPKSNEMILTVHRWFANKACPGDWLMARMKDLADKVTARLRNSQPQPTPQPSPTPQPVPEVPFKVRVTIKDLNIRTGAGTNYPKTGKTVIPGVYTIVEVQQGQGSKTGWGKLKSGIGWISLDFCKKI